MKCSPNQLFTPIYLKIDDKMPWPEDEPAFHLLTSEGLFLCRNHPLFQSCVRTPGFPCELAAQRPFLRLKYPRIPRWEIERVVGFFDVIGRRHQSEAAVLLVWNQNTRAIEIVVPEQTGIVSTGYYGSVYPVELEYEVPALPPHLLLVGDIHSHVDYAAYASGTDQRDEKHRPGLHLVVGRLYQEPPEFHCEVIADGMRFRIRDLGMIIEGYKTRREAEVPQEWIKKVAIQSPKDSAPKPCVSALGGSFGEGHDLQTIDGESLTTSLPEPEWLAGGSAPDFGDTQVQPQSTPIKPPPRK